MKIVFCINSISNFGGMERVLLEKANYFVEKYNYDVFIVTTEDKNKETFFEIDSKIKIKNIEVNYYDVLKNSNFYKKMILKELKKKEHKKKLQKLIDELEPDILVSMGDLSRDVVGEIKCKSKKILENHFNKAFFTGENEKNKIYRYIKTKMKRYSESKNFKSYDKFVVLTQEDKEAWEKEYSGEKICIINNFLTFIPQGYSKCENKKAISIGRLTDQKGYDMLIKAWKIVEQCCPEWKLEIYGEGPLRESLNKEILNEKLDKKVKLMGLTNQIQEKLINSSIYIMSSRYEGFGIVLIEAMACGLPLISFSCPCGPKDIIEDGKNGYLCEKNNIELLANKIIDLIKNEKLRKEMGTISKNMSNKYSKEKIMENWKRLHEER